MPDGDFWDDGLLDVYGRVGPYVPTEPMRVTVQAITTTSREVDVPALCPGCGADLHNGRLECEQLEYTEQIANTNAGEIVDWCMPEAAGPDYIAQGWRCLDCGFVLAQA